MAGKDFHIKINPKILVWARTSIGYPVSYVAQEMKLNAQEIIELESGAKQPTYEMIVLLSHIYKRPVAAFLLKEIPKENSAPKDFRTVRSAEVEQLADKTLLAIRRARGLMEDALELRNEMQLKLPQWKQQSVTIKEDPEIIAHSFRREFGLSKIYEFEKTDDALDYLIVQFENKGILVFQLPLTQPDVRGFSITDETVPIIVIRRGDRATAKMFTLFHELGHVLLHDGAICNFREGAGSGKIEWWCNQFAAGVLVPIDVLLKEEIVQEQKRLKKGYWQLNTLVELGQKNHVGPEVILRRLFNANLTSKKFYEEKHEQWSNQKSFGKGGKPRDTIKEKVKEKGKNFTRLAVKALESNKISLKDFADYMDVKIDQVNQVQAYL